MFQSNQILNNTITSHLNEISRKCKCICIENFTVMFEKNA